MTIAQLCTIVLKYFSQHHAAELIMNCFRQRFDARPGNGYKILFHSSCINRFMRHRIVSSKANWIVCTFYRISEEKTIWLKIHIRWRKSKRSFSFYFWNFSIHSKRFSLLCCLFAFFVVFLVLLNEHASLNAKRPFDIKHNVELITKTKTSIFEWHTT